MKKNGFTLIEVLAVIIVIAIITLIATPRVLDIIENSRKTSYNKVEYEAFSAVKRYQLEKPEDFIFSPTNYEIVVFSELVQLGYAKEFGDEYLTWEIRVTKLASGDYKYEFADQF